MGYPSSCNTISLVGPSMRTEMIPPPVAPLILVIPNSLAISATNLASLAVPPDAMGPTMTVVVVVVASCASTRSLILSLEVQDNPRDLASSKTLDSVDDTRIVPGVTPGPCSSLRIFVSCTISETKRRFGVGVDDPSNNNTTLALVRYLVASFSRKGLMEPLDVMNV